MLRSKRRKRSKRPLVLVPGVGARDRNRRANQDWLLLSGRLSLEHPLHRGRIHHRVQLDAQSDEQPAQLGRAGLES